MTYTAPKVSDKELTPEFVRDQLLLCFESANREFATVLNQHVTDEQLRAQVKGFVESVFSSCGVSFDDPSKQGILTAMAECRANAEKMMGPSGASIIQHHYDEMLKLANRLPE